MPPLLNRKSLTPFRGQFKLPCNRLQKRFKSSCNRFNGGAWEASPGGVLHAGTPVPGRNQHEIFKGSSCGHDDVRDRVRCVCDRTGSHALVDFRRRGRCGSRTREGVRRIWRQMGRRRHRRRRRHCAPDHDQPHHRRRPDGRHPVQPRPASAGTRAGRPDARPHRCRRGRRLEGQGIPEVASGSMHRRWPHLLRAGQHPLARVALAFQQGL